jgi:hypothetical protein
MYVKHTYKSPVATEGRPVMEVTVLQVRRVFPGKVRVRGRDHLITG